MQTVYLTRIELRIAEHVGKARHAESQASGRGNAYGLRADENLRYDISGAMCEMAVAKSQNFYWGATVNSFHGADIGNNVQVRGTRHPNGRLILREKDNPAHLYYFVIDRCPAFDVVGCVRGSAVMIPDYLKILAPDRPPCYTVPRERLMSV